MKDARSELMARVDELLDRAWALAALAAAVDEPRLSEEHRELLAACGFAGDGTGDGNLRSDYGAVLAAQGDPSAFPRRIGEMLRRAADAAEGLTVPERTDEAALLSDGRSSGAHMRVFLKALSERVPGFAELLDRGSPRFLDVGTGIGAISAVVVDRAPGSRAVGLDVDPRVLGLAQDHLREQGADSRVETRLQDVADLAETGAYDLAWLPLTALAREATEAALPRVRDALRPGGRLIAATALRSEPAQGEEDLHTAVLRWRLSREGATPWGPQTLRERMREHGFEDVRSVGAPTGTVELLVGRAPGATAT